MSTKKKEHHIIKEQFGRYLLLDHLVDGGMAKICRARYLGEQGEKIVAIKMVQPQFSKDEAFKTMFEDEVKVSFGLQHPNIAQTYDYGMMNDQLYTAMEYVDGKNLKQYLDELKKRKVLFPIEVSAYIISLACQGLHYAHTYTDKLSGQNLNLVHRDISPHNLMLTYDGSVKVIDFGIAKAETNSDATQAGTIKGKLSYLAPEYLEGMALDGRYDEFALGIVLWEMLCSRKLFTASNELAVLKEIQKCKIPAPSTINPTVPKELDQIVLKALSKDRNQRYDDLDKFNRALTKFLYAKYENFNPSDLGKFATALFKKEIEEDRILMREFGKIDVRPFLDNLKKGVNVTSSTGVAEDDGPKITKSEVFDFDLSGEEGEDDGLMIEGVQKKNETRIKPKLSRSKTATNIAIKRPAPNPSATSIHRMEANKTGTRTVTIKRGKSKSSTQTQTKTKSRSISKKSSAFPKVASFVILLAIGAGGFYWKSLQNTTNQASTYAKRMDTIEKSTREPSSETTNRVSGKVQLTNYENFKHEVFLDGKKITDISLGEFSVQIGTEHTIRVQQKDYKHFIRTFVLTKESPTVNFEIPQMEEMKYGYIITSDTSCIDGSLSFELFGEKRNEPLPIRSRFGIPVPVGPIYLTVIREGDMVGTGKEVRINKADEVVDLCEKFLW